MDIVQMRENAGKLRTRITPNADTFYAVSNSFLNLFSKIMIKIPFPLCCLFREFCKMMV